MLNAPTRRNFIQSSLSVAASSSSLVWAQSAVQRQSPKAGEKKGYAMTGSPDLEQKITELKAKWLYTWSAKRPANAPDGVDWVPMIHRDAPGHPASKALEEVQAQVAQKPTALLGFNEPDRKEQANMTVEQALALWPKLEALNLPLGSPSGAHPDGDWMLDFMKQATKLNYRIDFVTVHWYGAPASAPFLTYLDRVAKLYDKPLWITEFCPGDWSALKSGKNKYEQKEVLRFIKDTLPKLERASFVHRYAWFCATPENAALGCSALFNGDGKLNELGEAYAKEG